MARLISVRFRHHPRRYHAYLVHCDHHAVLGIDVQIGRRRFRLYWRSCDGC